MKAEPTANLVIKLQENETEEWTEIYKGVQVTETTKDDINT